jgi:hypothetical protein
VTHAYDQLNCKELQYSALQAIAIAIYHVQAIPIAILNCNLLASQSIASCACVTRQKTTKITMAHLLKMEGRRIVQKMRKRKSKKKDVTLFHERKHCCDISTQHRSNGPRGGIAAVLGLGMCRCIGGYANI